MAIPRPKQRLYTIEEYLQLEANSEERHEYHDGLIVPIGETLAMAGGTARHSQITMNIARELGQRLKGGPCRLYDSNLRVRIPRKTLYAYPDLSVICGRIELDPDERAGETATNPRVVIEVLSPSTEAYDRGGKFERYRELPSLLEYVLVSQHTATVEVYTRQDGGSWLFTATSGLHATAQLRSLHVDLPLAEVYMDVVLGPEAAPDVTE